MTRSMDAIIAELKYLDSVDTQALTTMEALSFADRAIEVMEEYKQAEQSLCVLQMPNPTEDDLNSPVFEAIWQVIKHWDVNVPQYYSGYCGANGSHVMLILNALWRVKERGEEQIRQEPKA